jgi:hypothetical protein
MPTGAQEDDPKRADLTAVQLSYGLRPHLVLTSTIGWARATPRSLGPEARLELRDYLTWGAPFGTPDTTRRNDVAVLTGLQLDLR